MKLFSLLASCTALAYGADTAQTVSGADIKTWKNDVLNAADTVKDIQSPTCKLPAGKKLAKLGDPTTVTKHFYKLSNGNTRSTYQYKFKDGTMVYAGNSNVGQTGGSWKIFCVRWNTTPHVVTNGPHNNDLNPTMIKRLRDIFKKLDKDGNGTIYPGAAYTGLSQVFPATSLPDYEALLNKMSIKSAGGDKVVDLDEFECVAKKLFNIQKVYKEFKQYDTNHDMKISRSELEKALMDFYFKDVAQPGLIQTANAKAQAKKTVDAIIKAHDTNHDQNVSWDEFEMDAFIEEHYKLGAKCQTSSTPLNSHEVDVVASLIKKFNKSTGAATKEMSHSQWYQVTSMLTEEAVDKMNGAAKPPALGCWNRAPTHPLGSGSGAVHHYFGQNGGNHFGVTPTPGLLGGRALLARFLQAGPGGHPGSGPGPHGSGPHGSGPRPHGSGTHSSVYDVLKALHKQADSNNDGKISDHEILDIFQGVRDSLTTSDFGKFLDMVNKLKGPVDCSKNKSCDKCTAVTNAGLCGWFAQKQSSGGSVFGSPTTSTGNCKFVDRSDSSDMNPGTDTAKPTTCSNKCNAQHTNLRPILP